MDRELSIISSENLTNVSKTEVDELIEEIVEKSKNNMEKICELTLECTSLLTSAESRVGALSSQGTFKRWIGDVTGKNQRARNAILQDNTNALYAAQGVINRVMAECTSNRALLVAVNDKINQLYLELQRNQNGLGEEIQKNRKAIAVFYKYYQEQDERVNQIENYLGERCMRCQGKLLSWQRICPYCGNIHPLKVNSMKNEDAKQILNQISKIVEDKQFDEDIIWDLTAKKTERVLRKVKALADIGKLPGYTEELSEDVEKLINKCKNAEFQIAVVGVMKAGKSYLMNALIGAEIASVEVNPETAALTKFRSANGFYVKIKYHNKVQWEKLKQSARNSQSRGEDSLSSQLNNTEIKKMESKWIGHENKIISCQDLKELQETVKKYTSSQEKEHLFVSEVEVGVDKSIFNMPKEVVFVDTPGLKDPVKYRSDITKGYIKKADAVLIALKPGPFTAEGLEIVTTVLDCTDKNKAYIVGTQKDLNNEKEQEKYVGDWKQKLVNAKRYTNNREIENKIMLTSAKMDMLIKRWDSLTEKEKEDEECECFSVNDYYDLSSYAGKVLGNRSRRFSLMEITQNDWEIVARSTGISDLKRKLDVSLISNYRKLKMEDIEKTFMRCKKQVVELSQNAVEQQENTIRLATIGAEELQRQVKHMISERDELKKERTELEDKATKIENDIRSKIKYLEGRGL